MSDDFCLTCGGTPHVSGLPCVCGGLGTRDAETDGLRRYAFELERAIGTARPALKWIKNHAPSPDPHALAGHAGVGLDALAKVSGKLYQRGAGRFMRLLRQYKPGQRVRAVETIIYGTGEEVPEGTHGNIQQTNVYGCTPLVTVAWDGLASVTQPCSVENLEPVP